MPALTLFPRWCRTQTCEVFKSQEVGLVWSRYPFPKYVRRPMIHIEKGWMSLSCPHLRLLNYLKPFHYLHLHRLNNCSIVSFSPMKREARSVWITRDRAIEERSFRLRRKICWNLFEVVGRLEQDRLTMRRSRYFVRRGVYCGSNL